MYYTSYSVVHRYIIKSNLYILYIYIYVAYCGSATEILTKYPTFAGGVGLIAFQGRSHGERSNIYSTTNLPSKTKEYQ